MTREIVFRKNAADKGIVFKEGEEIKIFSPCEDTIHRIYGQSSTCSCGELTLPGDFLR